MELFCGRTERENALNETTKARHTCMIAVLAAFYFMGCFPSSDNFSFNFARFSAVFAG